MVDFKEWGDYNKFMQTYAIASCQNCIGYQDNDNGQFVCMVTLSPVRQDMLAVCHSWQSSDGKVKDDLDLDMFPFKFSKDVWQKLENLDKEMTFEEIKEFIENEKFKEQKSN